jgi:hypothetical protein
MTAFRITTTGIQGQTSKRQSSVTPKKKRENTHLIRLAILNEKYRKILPHQGIDPKNLARAINREREQQLPRIDLADINYDVKLDKLKGKT